VNLVDNSTFKDLTTLFISRPEKNRIYTLLFLFVFSTFNPLDFHVRSLYNRSLCGFYCLNETKSINTLEQFPKSGNRFVEIAAEQKLEPI